MHILLLIFCGVIIWVFSSRAVDSLIEYHYENFRPKWEEAGSPRGMFFNPKGSSYYAFIKLSFSWHKGMPIWLAQDQLSLGLFKKVKFWEKITIWYAVLFFPILLIGEIF
jgi:hypothetical protein